MLIYVLHILKLPVENVKASMLCSFLFMGLFGFAASPFAFLHFYLLLCRQLLFILPVSSFCLFLTLSYVFFFPSSASSKLTLFLSLLSFPLCTSLAADGAPCPFALAIHLLYTWPCFCSCLCPLLLSIAKLLMSSPPIKA